jgi:hypothetical protein
MRAEGPPACPTRRPAHVEYRDTRKKGRGVAPAPYIGRLATGHRQSTQACARAGAARTQGARNPALTSAGRVSLFRCS